MIITKKHYRRMARLLSSIENLQSRDALVTLICALTSRKGIMYAPSTRCVELLLSLESLDKTRIEDPDLARRYTAYDEIQQVLSKDFDIQTSLMLKLYEKRGAEIDVEMLLVFAHSHAFAMLKVCRSWSLFM